MRNTKWRHAALRYVYQQQQQKQKQKQHKMA
jgi:hypothetical protein